MLRVQKECRLLSDSLSGFVSVGGIVGGLHHRMAVTSDYTPLWPQVGSRSTGDSFPRHFNVLYRSCPKGWWGRRECWV